MMRKVIEFTLFMLIVAAVWAQTNATRISDELVDAPSTAKMEEMKWNQQFIQEERGFGTILAKNGSGAMPQIQRNLRNLGYVLQGRKLDQSLTAFDERLNRVDWTLRGLDAMSTHRMLNDPCQCFHEADPIAPKGKGWGQIVGFQMAAGFAVQIGAAQLRQHGHNRLARWLVVADVASEGVAVGRNYWLVGSRASAQSWAVQGAGNAISQGGRVGPIVTVGK